MPLQQARKGWVGRAVLANVEACHAIYYGLFSGTIRVNVDAYRLVCSSWPGEGAGRMLTPVRSGTAGWAWGWRIDIVLRTMRVLVGLRAEMCRMSMGNRTGF